MTEKIATIHSVITNFLFAQDSISDEEIESFLSSCGQTRKTAESVLQGILQRGMFYYSGGKYYIEQTFR